MVKTTRRNGAILEWSKGSGNKKYKVVVYKKNGTKKTIQFGDKRYEQFRDKTPLHLYSKKDHGDSTRRKAYRTRHGAQGNHLKVFSPAWFSWHYLW